MRSILKNLRHVVINDGGSQIAEAAFVLPLLMMVLLGIMSFGRAFNVYSTITRAAQDGAAVAAASRCSTCGAAINPSDIADAVRSTLSASKVSPDQIATYTLSPEPGTCPALVPGACTTDASSKIRICRNVQLNPAGTGPKQCGAIVSFKYPYHFQIPFASINLTDIQMTAVAKQPMEN